jgi:hypothetical protein
MHILPAGAMAKEKIYAQQPVIMADIPEYAD